jgi:hypothetical protein
MWSHYASDHKGVLPNVRPRSGYRHAVARLSRQICAEPTGVELDSKFSQRFWQNVVLEASRLAIREGERHPAAEITVLRHVADQVPVADARTEILKAVAVLRDRI